MLRFTEFKSEFDRIVSEKMLDWEVLGFYDARKIIYPFGTDTKVISTVFEALSSPIIREIAENHGYKVETSEQTVYPDFTLVSPNKPHIAVDIKTTYRSGSKKFRYTLGSYSSFLRSVGAAKNILYPYAEYSDHWVIGFLYSRRPVDVNVEFKSFYLLENVNTVMSPYSHVEYFVQDKYKIVGLTPASGNTKNIGSFPTNDINDLRQGLGPFANYGKDICDDYWRNYDGTYKSISDYLRKKSDN